MKIFPCGFAASGEKAKRPRHGLSGQPRNTALRLRDFPPKNEVMPDVCTTRSFNASAAYRGDIIRCENVCSVPSSPREATAEKGVDIRSRRKHAKGDNHGPTSRRSLHRRLQIHTKPASDGSGRFCARVCAEERQSGQRSGEEQLRPLLPDAPRNGRRGTCAFRHRIRRAGLLLLRRPEGDARDQCPTEVRRGRVRLQPCADRL